MNAEYTPTMTQVAAAYWVSRGYTGRPVERPILDAEFERFVAQLRAEGAEWMRERAIRELTNYEGGFYTTEWGAVLRRTSAVGMIRALPSVPKGSAT